MKTGKDVFAELKAEGDVKGDDAMLCAAVDMASELAVVYIEDALGDPQIPDIIGSSGTFREAFEKGIDFGIYRFLVDICESGAEIPLEELRQRKEDILFAANKDNN